MILHAILRVLVMTFLFSLTSFAQSQTSVPSGFDFSHSALTEILQEYVIVRGPTSRVNYKGLKEKNSDKFNSYLKQLENVTKEEFSSWTKKQQYVFWVNAYNSYTIKLIIDNYPLPSIKKLGSLFSLSGFFKTPWEKEFFTLLGQKRHLDEIEHKILRVQFDEPRTHFAINCASISCPALLNEAFTAEKLEEQLERQAKSFLRDRSRNKISGNRLILSRIFMWFKDDFTKNGQTLQQFVAKYITDNPSVKAKLNNGKFKVDYDKRYDWRLNKPRKVRKVKKVKKIKEVKKVKGIK